MRVFLGLAAAAVFGLSAAGAEAASVTYSQFYPLNNNSDSGRTPQTFAPTDWDGTAQSVTLPRFDPALGTLTGVDLSLYGNIITSGTLRNTGASAANINNFLATLDISLLAPGTPVPWDSAAGGGLLTASPTMFNISAPVELAPGQSYSFGAGTPVNASDSSTASVADIAPYVGPGSLVFPLAASTGTLADTTGGNLQIVQNTAARAQASVTYTYDAAPTPTPPGPARVPEPGTAGLLGAGLLGLGLLRRRP